MEIVIAELRSDSEIILGKPEKTTKSMGSYGVATPVLKISTNRKKTNLEFLFY